MTSNLSANAGRIGVLESNVVDLTSNLSSNAGRITILESNVVDLTSNLSSNAGRITTLETKTTAISYTNSTTRIDGNLIVSGTTTTLDTVNLIVQDPIIQLSNASASVDSGILIARPSDTDNVFIGFDQSLSEFAIGFTDSHAGQSTMTMKDDQNFTMNVHGNVEASYYFGDGTKLTGIALNSDLSSNAVRITTLESNVVDLTSNLSSNAGRIGVLESNVVELTSNL